MLDKPFKDLLIYNIVIR